MVISTKYGEIALLTLGISKMFRTLLVLILEGLFYSPIFIALFFAYLDPTLLTDIFL